MNSEFPLGQAPPAELLERWIDESFRALVPKKIVDLLGDQTPAKPRKKSATKRTTKKIAARKAAKKQTPRKRARNRCLFPRTSERSLLIALRRWKID